VGVVFQKRGLSEEFFGCNMNKIYSYVQEGLLLHIINRLDEIDERTNVIDDDQFLQLATLRMDSGKTFPPHKHIWKSSHGSVIPQESWVVIKGSVLVYMYDLDDTLIAKEIIRAGDCSITLFGGHTYEILEDDTIVYEYKTGPYTGVENDKVMINDTRK